MIFFKNNITKFSLWLIYVIVIFVMMISYLLYYLLLYCIVITCFLFALCHVRFNLINEELEEIITELCTKI